MVGDHGLIARGPGTTGSAFRASLKIVMVGAEDMTQGSLEGLPEVKLAGEEGFVASRCQKRATESALLLSVYLLGSARPV